MTTRPAPKRPRRIGPSSGGPSSGGGEGEPPAHPLALAIDQIYAAAGTPRLVIDARRADVVVPEFLRSEWGKQLVIDLKASDPLDLVYDAAGVHATLSFGQQVTRCSFGWASIHQLIDRSNGRGIVIGAHEPPAELAAELAYTNEVPITEIAATKRKPTFALVSDRDSPGEKEVSPPAAEPEAKTPSASDEEAKARRAKFRVIDGG